MSMKEVMADDSTFTDVTNQKHFFRFVDVCYAFESSICIKFILKKREALSKQKREALFKKKTGGSF